VGRCSVLAQELYSLSQQELALLLGTFLIARPALLIEKRLIAAQFDGSAIFARFSNGASPLFRHGLSADMVAASN
jgi:hypothetical protein